ncbi:MAG TPA: hypothetical protein VEY30_05950, partial [Myxococcaceae bacterium]|nr:hypothetical protein [Myxococcaceae bacterium]
RVLLFCHRAQLPVAGAALVRIDAARWFGAAVEACLFTVELREGSRTYEAEVFDHVQADAPARRMGVRCDGVVPDLAIYERYAGLDGRFPIRWRQGVKHDAASALELKRHADGWLNSQGEPVEVESDYLYPLLKGTDVHRGHPPSRKLLLPQRTLGEDTHTLAERAPKAWSYLQRNLPVFERRKSSIYRNRPPFSVFGVGPYALAPFKVAVSGLHSALHFRAVGPECGRPVLFDDTCYFLPCRGPEQAALLEAILNSDPSRSFFSSLVLPGAKRPVTQRILQRLEVARLIANLNAEEITASARRGLEALGLGDALSASSLAQEFRSLPDP